MCGYLHRCGGQSHCAPVPAVACPEVVLTHQPGTAALQDLAAPRDAAPRPWQVLFPNTAMQRQNCDINASHHVQYRLQILSRQMLSWQPNAWFVLRLMRFSIFVGAQPFDPILVQKATMTQRMYSRCIAINLYVSSSLPALPQRNAAYGTLLLRPTA